MADPKDKTAAADTKEPAGAKGGSKLVVILLAVNTLLSGGAIGVVWLRTAVPHAPPGAPAGAAPEGAEKTEKGEKGEKGDAKGHAIGPTVRLAEFVVHLRDTEADHYARVTFDLEVATEEDKTKVGLAAPRIRDGIIAYLADRSFEELRGSDGLEKTKVQLLERVQQATPGTKVKNLYISDIVVQ
jgi:flagellar FliL protein